MRIDEKRYRATVRVPDGEASCLVSVYNLDPARKRVIAMEFVLQMTTFQRDPSLSLPSDREASFREELILVGEAAHAFEDDRANDRRLIEQKMKEAFGGDGEVDVTLL